MFIFNGKHASEFNIKVISVWRNILPTLSSRLVEIPNGIGAYDFGTTMDAKTITVEIFIETGGSNEVAKNLRGIAEWLYSEKLAPLIFDDEPDKTYMARISGDSEIEEIFKYGKGELQFLCPNPLAMGKTITETFTDGIGTLNNKGTYKTSPTFEVEFTAPSNSVKLMLVETGDAVSVISNFQAGDIIRFEFDNRNILFKKSGSDNFVNYLDKLTLESDFFFLEKGISTIHLSTIGGANFTAEFTERFL